MASKFLFTLLAFTIAFVQCESMSPCTEGPEWEMLKEDVGVSAMHLAMSSDDKFIIFDYTYSAHTSTMKLPEDKPCIERDADPFHNHRPKSTKQDCWAHSVEFDPDTEKARPLTLYTDTWCSSAAMTASGTIVQNGGSFEGGQKIRMFYPRIPNSVYPDWVESSTQTLLASRWYSTSQLLPDDSLLVMGGKNEFTYEFIPRRTSTPVYLPFLRETTDFVGKDNLENNLYPFVHLLPDGNVFVFANTQSILLDYTNNKVLRTYPDMPLLGISRNYPSTGSSMLLPLDLTQGAETEAEIMVCGGTPKDAALHSMQNGAKVFVKATDTCGRLKVTDKNPEWVIETMPMPRVMSDMVLLPTGDEVLIINGASSGSAGWDAAVDPVLTPVLYRISTRTFTTLGASCRPRMYHSTAQMMPDGRVLVGGGNSHQFYEFNAVFPTDVSLQAFSPPYIFANSSARPFIWAYNYTVAHGAEFQVEFSVGEEVEMGEVSVHVMSYAFSTHSYVMNQKVVRLVVKCMEKVNDRHLITAMSPPSTNLAPAGYYRLFVVYRGIPSNSTRI